MWCWYLARLWPTMSISSWMYTLDATTTPASPWFERAFSVTVRGFEGRRMSADDLIMVSVDDHLVEPPDMFETTIPAKWRDRAPHVVRQEDGSDVWTFEGSIIPNIGLNAVAGRPKEEYGIEPTAFDEMRPGCFEDRKSVV